MSGELAKEAAAEVGLDRSDELNLTNHPTMKHIHPLLGVLLLSTQAALQAADCKPNIILIFLS
jgi:hypothetical protein